MALLVTPDALGAELDAGRMPLVIDLRPTEEYVAGHIPGAVHLDLWGLSLIDTDPAPLRAFFWIIEHLFASRGVSQDVPVVVYDDIAGMRAARAFWFLEYFGHPDVRLLDGGYDAWRRAGLPASCAPVKPGVSDWQGTRRAELLATWREVQGAIGDPGARIVDTRSDGEYCGTVVRAARGGAIPSAIHIEWKENLRPDGTFKPVDVLRELYARAGVTPDTQVVTYCQGGYRAAHSYLALRLLGFPRVQNYVGSWREWGDRLDLPVEHPNRA